MKRFSIPPREERERHSHTMSAYILHPQIPYSSERQRKDEGGHGKMENKYPIREFIQFCCDSIPHQLITI